MHLTKLASIQLIAWNVLVSNGVEPRQIFQNAGLDPEFMYQPGARYPLSAISRLWQEMDKVLLKRNPSYGLTAADHWHPSNFGTLGYAMLACTSIRQALERMLRYHQVISDADFGRLSENSEDEVLRFIFQKPETEIVSPAREDAAFAWLLSMLRVNFQRPLSPVAIGLSHDGLGAKDKYYAYFTCPVIFNSPLSYLEFSFPDADRILPSANEELLQFGEHAMNAYLLQKESGNVRVKVQKLIAEHLPSGDATITKIAEELSLSRRKLQRILRQHGTTYKELLNEIRLDLAKKYIGDMGMDLTEIAFLLGFSEQSTFSRSFKRWTGTSPTAFRKAS